MILFLGFIFQLAASVVILFFGYAAATNLGWSSTNGLEKVIGIIIMGVGSYGLYDLSTMFNYVG